MMFVPIDIYFQNYHQIWGKIGTFPRRCWGEFYKIAFFNIAAKMPKCLKLGFNKHFLNLNKNIQINS